MDEISEELRIEIVNRRMATGLSQNAFAKRIDTYQQTYQRIESGETKSSRYLAKILHELGIKPVVAETQSSVPSRETVPLNNLIGSLDLPVYEARPSSTGEVLMSREPGVFVARPQPLIGVSGGYGLYVPDDSMKPAYKTGDIVHVHPAAPLQNEEDVVLLSAPVGSGGRLLIRQLLGWSSQFWEVRCYNPENSEVADSGSIERVDWPVCHRIVGRYCRG